MAAALLAITVALPAVATYALPSSLEPRTALSSTTRADAPRRLVAVPGDRRATLTWRAPVGAPAGIRYRVQQVQGATWSTVVASTDRRTVTVTGLSNGTRYRFRVLTVDGTELSDPTGPVTVTPLAAPSAPRDLAGTGGDEYIDLTWRAPTRGPVTNYRIEQFVAGSWKRVASARSTSRRMGGLTNGTTYKYRVVGVNATGAGTPSRPVTATAGASAPWSCASVTDIPTSECAALVALAGSTAVDNWKDRSGWLRSARACTW